MNKFKFLPKIYKRDKTSDKFVFYHAIIDGVESPRFLKKCDLIAYISDQSSSKVFHEISMFKTIVQSLIH